jgi:predicted DNA-binding protein
MALFLLAVTAIAAGLIVPLSEAFLASPALNGLILGVFLLGILFNFRQVLMVGPEVAWIEHFRADGPPRPQASPPSLLAPMAAMLGERHGRLSLSAPAMRSLLDGIASRLDESRDLSRYTISLLILLGLLGTFWGLMQTIGSVSGVIGGLAVDSIDITRVLGDLKRGLQAPLSGMGTAFSTSLFGLAGSLVLGFLDLQAGQAQNRFFTDLEDWLSGVTRLPSGGPVGEGDQGVPAYVQALLEQTAESLDQLQQTLSRGEESRAATSVQVLAVAEKIGTLTDQMRTQQTLMLRLAENHSELKPILAHLSDRLGQTSAAGLDEATRGHIRNIEMYLARLVADAAAGREHMVQQVRGELRLLARTMAARVDESERR